MRVYSDTEIMKAAGECFGVSTMDDLIEEIKQEEYDYGTCQTLEGETVEPDGYGQSGSPSFMLALGLI